MSSASLASPTPRPPPLYRHVLQVVFGFLTLRDLHSVLAVCRGWQDAVCNGMQSIQGSAVVGDPTSHLAVSRLGVLHVSNLQCTARLDAATLVVLSSYLRSLASLAFIPLLPEQGATQWAFPPKLTSLHIQIRSYDAVPPETLFSPLPHLQSLRHLHLDCGLLPPSLPWIDACTQITHLHIGARLKVHVNKAIISTIRAMTRLEVAQFDIDAIDRTWVDCLFAQPRTLQWHTLIVGPISISPAFHPIAPRLMAAAADSMSTIAQFHAILSSVSRFDFDYRAQAKNGTYSVEVNALATDQSLRIHRRDVMPHEKHIVELIPRFTNLTCIELVEMPGLKALDFLLSPQTLRSLELRDLRSLSSFGIAAIRQCKALRSLVIKGCFDSPISPGALEAFRVPSVELPELRSFEFEPRVFKMHSLSSASRITGASLPIVLPRPSHL